ncbi:MAG: trypsin-like peptidase domain-containing protein [Verrucomicrobiae bacterium]|nr:trypsin-like peptidase domain-containing protein [Verrucomicrobiae bacterium]
MITANIIYRVFRIKCGNESGTAFAIDVDGRQYLATAKHVLDGYSGSDSVEIYANGGWQDLKTEKVGDAGGDVDVSVLATPNQLTPPRPFPLPPDSDGIVYGQDAFFLGYPYGLMSKFSLGTSEGGYPLPLVKRALVSSFEGGVFLLDGHNNPGFSGAPVVFKPQGVGEFKVAGIISGYKSVTAPIFSGADETPFSHQVNTGIIVSYDIKHAVELAKANPIGCVLQTNGTEAAS